MNTATGETNGQKKGQEREELDKKQERIITRSLRDCYYRHVGFQKEKQTKKGSRMVEAEHST